MLEYAKGFGCFEIKSARTIQSSFFSGLNTFERDIGRTRQRHIVYAGAEQRIEKNTHISSWHGLNVSA